RYALNFQSLPYKTEWIEYPDIETVAKDIGAKSTGIRARKPLYTVPMIYDNSTNVAVADSITIAEYCISTRLIPTILVT
ncbi:hypothetical protein C8J56DRAFT_1124548, partial [Mycena floridula]